MDKFTGAGNYPLLALPHRLVTPVHVAIAVVDLCESVRIIAKIVVENVKTE